MKNSRIRACIGIMILCVCLLSIACIPCGQCNGTGKVACYHCSGDGIKYGYQCIYCKGTGRYKCPSCNGTGGAWDY